MDTVPWMLFAFWTFFFFPLNSNLLRTVHLHSYDHVPYDTRTLRTMNLQTIVAKRTSYIRLRLKDSSAWTL